LVRRSGFGATGTQVDAAVRMGAQAYLRQIIAADPTADPGARATPLPHFDPVTGAPGKNASKQQRADHNKQLADQLKTLTAWWLRRMVAVEAPFGEKLTFLWHNHFATSAQKVRQAPLMLAQNEKLRTLGRGDFHALAYGMLTDAAMLRWLDGEKNTAKPPTRTCRGSSWSCSPSVMAAGTPRTTSGKAPAPSPAGGSTPTVPRR